MSEFSNIEQVWKALDEGIKVFWNNPLYEVWVVRDPVPEKELYSERNGQMLRITCAENGFGSRLDEQELNKLYTVKKND